jgi:Zn-dependent protease
MAQGTRLRDPEGSPGLELVALGGTVPVGWARLAETRGVRASEADPPSNPKPRHFRRGRASIVDFLQRIDLGSILIQYAVLLFSLSLHEASHAWMADRCGDYTARYMGRVTLNPIAHMDPIGTLLFPLLQFFTKLPLIGWAKPVPVNSVHLRNPRRDQMMVSLAGPGSNLLAAAASFAMLAALEVGSQQANVIIKFMARTMRVPHDGTVLAPLLGMLFFLFIINMALALFNLIPIPPLDGHWLLYGVLPYNSAQALARIGSYGTILLYGLMILGVLRYVLIPVQWALFLLDTF